MEENTFRQFREESLLPLFHVITDERLVGSVMLKPLRAIYEPLFGKEGQAAAAFYATLIPFLRRTKLQEHSRALAITLLVF